MILNSPVYDKLKFFAQILLPALGTLYFALAGIWGLPHAEEIVGTIVALDTFLGVVLKISSDAYNKSDEKYDGSLNVFEDDSVKRFTLTLEVPPEELERKDSILFKVNPTKGEEI